MKHFVRAGTTLLWVIATVAIPGCGWRGVNSIPLPGTQGQGPGSYQVQAQMPNVTNIQPNSRVRVGDVTVGTITRIERQGWHALITMRINGDVDLPANATVKLGQTSVLGTVHVELAPPTDVPAQGKLRDGALIPLAHAGAYPTTEQTLSVAAMFLNGGGLGQIQDITKAFSTAFGGREEDLRTLIRRVDEFVGELNQQKDDILTATDRINSLASQFADQQPVIDKGLRTIPDALAVLKDQRENLVQAFDRLGKFSALAADSANHTKAAFVQELRDLAPVLESLANAGPALTRSLSLLPTFPWPKEDINKVFRGDAANITMIIDLTLSRLDTALFTGTRWEGNLTQLEMQWGRTIGQLPSPVTAGNPLVVPYHRDQGP
ncbi:mammalian cell entry protein [Mycobacterium paraense]|uniref:Mammalian cell entry protein n=1 Tax=Mycobacterium paraense TaxID=767916 RepID=A0A1X2A6I3_9MYCO|nr:MCE family protein [Mycobacterium paraense]ORW41766.1 mammalian cell entry protein [Mycobacterium paraense]